MKLEKLNIEEWHSTHLSTICMRAVYHREKGEVDGLMETALYTGCLNDELMNRMHTKDGLLTGRLPVEDCMDFVVQKAKSERRTFAPAVQRDKDDIAEEVARNAEHYRERMGEYFSKCKIIGVQIGMRFTLECGLGEVHYATHNDLLFRNPADELVNLDFKWKEKKQTVDELSRHPQPAMMHLAIVEGQCNIGGKEDDWVMFNEMPVMWWVDSRNFKAYMKASPDGLFKKGDVRPLDKLITEFRLTEENHETMKDELLERPVIASAGMWPKTVGDHCNYCPSLGACNRLTRSTEP